MNRRRRTVQLAAAVIGHHNRIRPVFDRQLRIFRFHNPFNNQLTAPQILNSGNIVPAQARVELFGSPRRQRRQIADVFRMADDIAESSPLGMQHIPAPFPFHRQIDAVQQRRFGRCGQTVFNVLMALPQNLQVGSQNQRRAFCRLCPLNQIFHKFAVAHYIKLKPKRRGSVFSHIFNRTNRHRRQ